MADNSGNIQLNPQKAAGAADNPETDLTAAMMKNATDQDYSIASVRANKAKHATEFAGGAILGNLGINLHDEPDEKDYHLEADEINELFRVSQS